MTLCFMHILSVSFTPPLPVLSAALHRSDVAAPGHTGRWDVPVINQRSFRLAFETATIRIYAAAGDVGDEKFRWTVGG